MYSENSKSYTVLPTADRDGYYEPSYGQARKPNLKRLAVVVSAALATIGLLYKPAISHYQRIAHSPCSRPIPVEKRAHRILSTTPLIGKKILYPVFCEDVNDKTPGPNPHVQMDTLTSLLCCVDSTKTTLRAKNSPLRLRTERSKAMSTSPDCERAAREARSGACSLPARQMAPTFRMKTTLIVSISSTPQSHPIPRWCY